MSVKKADIKKKAGPKKVTQKRLIEEAATAGNNGKPVRASRKAKVAVKAVPAAPHVFTMTEYVDVQNTMLASLDMSGSNLTRLDTNWVVENLTMGASSTGLFAGLEKALCAMADTLTEYKLQNRIEIGMLSAGLDVETYDAALRLRVDLQVTRFHDEPAMLPIVDHRVARKALESMFETTLAVVVDYSDNENYKYKVVGDFLFHEDMHEPRCMSAPMAESPEEAIILLFYMVYEFIKKDLDNAVELQDAGCADFRELDGFLTVLAQKGNA